MPSAVQRHQPHAPTPVPDGSDQLGSWKLGLELLRHASWKQLALLLLAIVSPFLLASFFALHQRSDVIGEAHDGARRSVVALEQHAANVVDAHALILRQLEILTHGRGWDQIRG